MWAKKDGCTLPAAKSQKRFFIAITANERGYATAFIV